MKVLELFAGSRSIGKVAQELGVEVFSVDIEAFEGIDLIKDIEFLTLDDLPWIPDLVVAGVPCTSYSICGIRYHRSHQIPVSDFAVKSDRLVKAVLKLVADLGCVYFIENPRGLLRKMEFMQFSERRTIWYCQYGDNRAKPTDLFSNDFFGMFNLQGWKPRNECHNGNNHCHHDKQARSHKRRKQLGQTNGGTTGMKGNFERSVYPPELCLDILRHYKNKFDAVDVGVL